jgi:hypothetical protein
VNYALDQLAIRMLVEMSLDADAPSGDKPKPKKSKG